MKIGIIPNSSKDNILPILRDLVCKIEEYKLDYCIGDCIKELPVENIAILKEAEYVSNSELGKISDIVISIGGDGTMLNTAYEVRDSDTHMLGLNLGKLGFLAEFDMNCIDPLLKDIKENNLIIDERIALEGVCSREPDKKLFGINDIVIDKGRWPKMITLTIKVNDDYVATFSADGLIIATPTGSTGYSLSAGGPIVSPDSKVITLSPISPHTLTMRPLILSSEKKISITVESPFESVQVNCDGQRDYYYEPPFTLEVVKGEKPIKLVHTNKTNYFEILRDKLLWGLDVRNNKHS